MFIVSDEALYRFDAGRQGTPGRHLAAAYDAGDRPSPGRPRPGPGTTPTIINVAAAGRYVAITDNADPRMHVLVFRAGRGRAGPPPVCRIPVFGEHRGAPTTP